MDAWYLYFETTKFRKYIDGLVQGCNIFIANALEILQSYTKPSICKITFQREFIQSHWGYCNLDYSFETHLNFQFCEISFAGNLILDRFKICTMHGSDDVMMYEKYWNNWN